MSYAKHSIRTAVFAVLSLSAAAPGFAAVDAAPSARTTLQVAATRVGEGAFARIQPGMTQRDVTALIGAPARTMRFERTRTTAWDYDFRDAWGYDAELSVLFNDDGIVVDKIAGRHDA